MVRRRRRTDVLVCALSLISVLAVSACDAESGARPVALIQDGRVCGMAEPSAVTSAIGTDDYRLGRGDQQDSTGLTSTKKRSDRADTCYLLPKAGNGTLLSMAASHHRSGPPATSRADDLRSAARDAPSAQGCRFEQIAGLGAVETCNGDQGFSVKSVGPTRYVQIRLPGSRAVSAQRAKAALALARNVDDVVAASDARG